LRLRYGMDGDEPMSLTGIAKSLRISRDRTRRLEREGLSMLRSSPQELRAYMVV
ncbi:MAG: sigma factor-like helix-turn-helix DNA-binding protein, partial [Prochlorococcus sp.]